MNFLNLLYNMFNGIIFNTGRISKIIKTKNSMTIGVNSNLKLNQKDLEQGLLKPMEVIGTADLILSIVRLGNNLTAQCINVKVKLGLLKEKIIF